MKRVISMLVVVFLIVSLFAACGKKETADDKAGTAGNEKVSNTPATGTPPTTNKANDAAPPTAEVKEQKVYPSASATLDVADGSNPGGLTQVGQAYGSNMHATALFNETLLKWDAVENNGKAGLAESWEWVDDLTLRLHLNEGVTSINGDPFTANDVVYSFNVNHETATLASYYNIFDYDKLKAVDDYTVDIALNEPYPYLQMDLAHSAYEVIVEASAKAAGGVENLKMNPIAGTGPYKLVKIEDGVCVYAERRDDYWGTVPYYKYINFHVVPDSAARFMGIESGDFQVIFNASMTSVAAAKDNSKVKAWTFTHVGRGAGMQLNSDTEKLAILEVRQAIALAIDYEAIVKVAAAGLGVVSEGAMLNQYSPWFTPASDQSKNFLGHTDIELAKQKMIDAGYPDGFEMSLKYKGNDALVITSAEIIQNNLERIGIEVVCTPLEAAKFSADCRSGEWEATLASGGNPNPKRKLTTIDPRLDHNKANGSCGQNWFGDADVTAMIDKCCFTPDGPELVKAWAELDNFCREHVPNITIVLPYATVVTSSDIVGLDIVSMGTPDVVSLYPQEYLDGPSK